MLNSFSYKSAKATLSFFLLSLFFLTMACDKNTTSPNVNDEISANQDAAESVASDLGQNSGGTVDQIADLSTIATAENQLAFTGLAKASASVKSYDATYNSSLGVWTISVIRNFNNGQYLADVERVYQVQFLNSAGDAQMFYVSRGDTADTVKLDIISGSGKHTSPRLSQELKDLSGSLVATNIKSGIMTINGSYLRSAVDTLTTMNATRTLDHTLTLTVTNLTCPVGAKDNAYQYLSGTINGTYNAEASFINGSGYSNRAISHEINLVFGEGEAAITINGETYTADIEAGELTD